ncbi:hypothetical protein T4D_15868 [Trichinella pseudospiralis]|uniref:Uncharacterized protein n=1 Tax=Trichinella pseudospiralis TaxID=6337 RepID=A0A0V1DP44_TRIPS|nr:hypothetical protein T4D_15868 [Trichinella pseudospiralis]
MLGSKTMPGSLTPDLEHMPCFSHKRNVSYGHIGSKQSSPC